MPRARWQRADRLRPRKLSEVIGQPQVNGQSLPRLIMEAFPNGVETIRGLLQDPAAATANTQRVPTRFTYSDRPYREVLWNEGFQIDDPTPVLVQGAVSLPKQQAEEMLQAPAHWQAASTGKGTR